MPLPVYCFRMTAAHPALEKGAVRTHLPGGCGRLPVRTND
jgi:hypothetical protein